MAKRQTWFSSRTWQRAVLPVMFILALIVLAPQADRLGTSLTVIKGARLEPLWLAVSATVATYLVAAGIYVLLAKHRVRYGRTLLVQIATAFVNRLLPAGVGGMSLNVQYLRSANHTTAAAVSVAATNNALGAAGNAVLLAGMVATGRLSFGRLHIAASWSGVYAVSAVLVIILLAALLSAGVRKWLQRMLRGALEVLAGYRRHPARLLAAFCGALLLTLLYTFALRYSAQAVGVSLSIGVSLIILSAGTLIGAATPTPGGLVGVEAGLVAGLVAYGATAEQGVAVALLYRLVTYWAPLIPGVIAFATVKRYILVARP